jgi:predicted nucleic acid-binding protein
MKVGSRKIYWCTNLFIAWLKDEKCWPNSVITGIQDVVYEVESNDAILFTSSLTRAEIFMGTLTADQKAKYAGLMRRTNVTEISADARITDRASSIREFYNTKGTKIQTPDAIHLATAIVYKADEFQTLDGLGQGSKPGEIKLGKLLALNGSVAGYSLRIVHPYPKGSPPDTIAKIEGPLFPNIP